MSAAPRRYVQASRALFRAVGPEVILTVVGRDRVDSLQGPAAAAWGLLRDPMSTDELAAELGLIYQQRPDRIAKDVEALMRELLDRGFVEEVRRGDG